MPVNDQVNAIDGVDSEGPSINNKNEGEDLFSLADYIQSQLKEDQVREELAQNSKYKSI